MFLIDTHAHLYLKDFKEDFAESLERMKQAHVKKVLLPNIDRASADSLLALVDGNPELFVPMMGLHPCSVEANYKQELAVLHEIFLRQEIDIVGEIGLDYYWSTEFKTEQIDAFRTQIGWAKANNAPIAIHCRNAYEDIISILKDEQADNLTGVLHCFSGTLEDANELIDLGYKLGIGGVVTFKNSGLDKIVEQIDMKHIILETDAPYLAPVPYRGKRNESSYVKLVAEKVATIKGIEVQEVARLTTANAIDLFGITL